MRDLVNVLDSNDYFTQNDCYHFNEGVISEKSVSFFNFKMTKWSCSFLSVETET